MQNHTSGDSLISMPPSGSTEPVVCLIVWYHAFTRSVTLCINPSCPAGSESANREQSVHVSRLSSAGQDRQDLSENPKRSCKPSFFCLWCGGTRSWDVFSDPCLLFFSTTHRSTEPWLCPIFMQVIRELWGQLSHVWIRAELSCEVVQANT